MAADQADKGWSETRARENITRENAEINKELAALQAKMEEYEKAYLATNTNYARLQTALSEAGKGWWGRTNSRRAELEVRVAKLRKQTERSPQDEADLQNALAELGPLRERFRAVRKEEERISGKLGIIRYEARQTAEYKELGRQYMLLQMQKWDIGSKNEKLRSAQQATVDKKRLFEEQLAQHPELQQARQRMDEARRAYGDADWVGR